ncbi:calcium-binding protein [Acetobacteraceae bacterium H6797]|nr:calcium-binding protein [Acetobacteraceae bacterium H6797]
MIYNAPPGTGYTLIGTNGADEFHVSTAISFAGPHVIDGLGGQDRLFLDTSGKFADSAFDGITDVETLLATNGLAQFTLGAAASSAFDGLIRISVLDGGSINVNAADLPGETQLVVYGGALTDVVTGSVGDDNIKGGGGADRLRGGAGNDLFRFDDLQQLATVGILDGGIGNDVVQAYGGGTLTDSNFANISRIETLKITVGTASLTLGDEAAASFGNILRINASTADALHLDGSGIIGHARLIATGSDGSDTFIDGAGNDILSGGAGADTFVFLDHGTASHDIITDYIAGVDKIDLTAFDGLTFDSLRASARQSGDDLWLTLDAAHHQYLVLRDSTVYNLRSSDILLDTTPLILTDRPTLNGQSFDFSEYALQTGWREAGDERTTITGTHNADTVTLNYAGHGLYIGPSRSEDMLLSSLTVDLGSSSEPYQDRLNIELTSTGSDGTMGEGDSGKDGTDGGAANGTISDIVITGTAIDVGLGVTAMAGKGGDGGWGSSTHQPGASGGDGGDGGDGGAADAIVDGATISATLSSYVDISLYAQGGEEGYFGLPGDGGPGGDKGDFGHNGQEGQATARIAHVNVHFGDQEDQVSFWAAATTVDPAVGDTPSWAPPPLVEIKDNVVDLGGGDDSLEVGGYTRHIVFSGNTLLGGAGTDKLSVNFEADLSGVDLRLDLRAGEFRFGDQTNIVSGFEDFTIQTSGSPRSVTIVDGTGDQSYSAYYKATYVFADGHGQDVIRDFYMNPGKPGITFEGLHYADLAISIEGNSTVIRSGEGDTLTLQDFTATLTERDFVFT